jgi:1-acyl-sn-glycerol-3-phosphate acyltransferase
MSSVPPNADLPSRTGSDDSSLGAAPRPYEPPLRKAYLQARCVACWAAACSLFFVVCPLLVLLGAFVDPRKNDAPGFDPRRTCFLISNHVNMFDPFVLYSSIPQFFRGLELESHFRIPVYGWLMKRFGNVPVPDDNRPSDLKRMWRLTRAALDSGISLLVFPEGSRTLTGRVGDFYDGVFRMAVQFGTPIVPVSITGSFEFNRKTSRMLRPATIVVYLHDVIETAGMSRQDIAQLRDRVREIVAAPVHAAMQANAIKREGVQARESGAGAPKIG